MMFHLNIFYLSVLKQVVRQYKLWNDVMFWFSQIIIYEQQKQYVLTTSQGNQVIFGGNAGKQCVTISVTAAVFYHHIADINFWTSSTLNKFIYHCK